METMGRDDPLSQKVKNLFELTLTVSPSERQKKIAKKEAVKLCKKEKFRYELQYGRHEGFTLISYAAHGGHQFLMDILLDTCNVDPKIQDDIMGTTPLHFAARNGHSAVVDALVSRYHCPVDGPDSCGSTALCFAIMRGQVSTIITLIGLGASLEVHNSFGTPLHIAAFVGAPNILQIVHEARPEGVNHELYGFCKPILAAMCNRSLACVDYLAKYSNVQQLAYKALVCFSAEEEAVECLEILLDHGMDPNLYDQALYEELPIVFAARRGWTNAVETLLPRSTKVDGITWSADGLFEYVGSEKFKVLADEQKEIRLSNLRARFIVEMENHNCLAANYILKVLHLDMANEDYVLLESLHGIISTAALTSYPVPCTIDGMLSYGLAMVTAKDFDGALRAGQASLALDRENKESQDFIMTVIDEHYGAGAAGSTAGQ